MFRFVIPVMLLCFVSMLSLQAAEEAEYSFDIWDWTEPALEPLLFNTWVKELADLGFTRVELSVPWYLLETEPGRYDLRWLEERIHSCEKLGLGMRLRINSYYPKMIPDWYEGDRWMDVDGKEIEYAIPSLMDARFWEHYAPLCTEIAKCCRNRNVLYNAFIGIHGELKYGHWWHYDPATLKAWREVIAAPRPAWLAEAAGDHPLPDYPPEPEPTAGLPDTSPVTMAVIAFREYCWHTALQRFEEALKAGDPDARISAPLGESYRRESAAMANLDYFGLTRGAAQVVHSYDFFWHAQDPAWVAAASVAAFQGITGLPVVFEFDGAATLETLGYTLSQLLAIGQSAAQAGAGLKIANRSYLSASPSAQPELRELLQLWREQWRPPLISERKETVLLFFSKWANYLYREDTEWLHDAQFGVYKLLVDAKIPVRIINEDNLDEDLSGYRAFYMAFSPRNLLPSSARKKIDTLPLLIIEDFPEAPALKNNRATVLASGIAQPTVFVEDCPVGAEDLSHLGAGYDYALTLGERRFFAHRRNHVVCGYPVGSLYLKGPDPMVHQGLILWALQQGS